MRLRRIPILFQLRKPDIGSSSHQIASEYPSINSHKALASFQFRNERFFATRTEKLVSFKSVCIGYDRVKQNAMVWDCLFRNQLVPILQFGTRILRTPVGGSLSESRKILPHSMERQRRSEIHHGTAPEDSLCCNGPLLCLSHNGHSGFGGVRQARKNLCCDSLRETPLPTRPNMQLASLDSLQCLLLHLNTGQECWPQQPCSQLLDS